MGKIKSLSVNYDNINMGTIKPINNLRWHKQGQYKVRGDSKLR
jgi:hypothetical protein